MTTSLILIKRNVKLFFKDKGLFFTSLITPGILLVLYATFLSNVYRDSFTTAFEGVTTLSDGVIEGLVGAQLVSSLLAVSCITVAFCSNFLMVQDKVNGSIKDLRIAPVSSRKLSLCYYVANLISTLIISAIAVALCLLYLSFVGWYMSFADVLLLILDVVLLVLFGTALSSIVNYFLSSQGQISAVGTIISSCYGFICGAYMPISSFSSGLQKVLTFLPGTYGTSLLRNHTMRGVIEEMGSQGAPAEATKAMYDLLDCNIYFFDNRVEEPVMYIILSGSVIALIATYIIMNSLAKKKR